MRNEYMLMELCVSVYTRKISFGGILTHPVRVSVLELPVRLEKLTMATLRPNWFLISPVLMASGAFSAMSCARCLIPMFAVRSSDNTLN
jgi:hypothetical protein